MFIPYLKVGNCILVRRFKFINGVRQKCHPAGRYHRTGVHCSLSKRCFNSSDNTKYVDIKSGSLNQDYLSLINTRVQTCLSTGEWSTPDAAVESALAMEYSYRQKLALTKEFEYEKEQIYERMYTWTPER